MELSRLVQLTTKVRATSKKTEKVSLIADFLRQTHGEETKLAALYLTGTLPQGRIGVGWKLIEAGMTQAPSIETPLTLIEMDRVFSRIASDEGPGSFERKIEALRGLFQKAHAEERRFLAQLLMGELRQGALEGIVLETISKASGLPLSDIREAMMFSGNIGEVARVALEEGAGGLSRIGFRLFSPFSPMLANSAENVQEALERLGEASFEFKLDGARIQVHKGKDQVKVFSRQLQEVTERLPEVVEWVRKLPVRDAVLEGEVIALRPHGRPHPFQVTMRRFGRIKDVDLLRQEIPLTSFFFDCLYFENEPLFSQPYQKRFEILTRTIPKGILIPQVVTAKPEVAEQFLQRALESGHEGLMAKSLQAPYTAGQRGYHWLKLKKARTLDLVILAAEWGSGRRTGWLSNLHLGVWDPESGRFVMLGKTFKGLTDEMLRWQTERLLSLEVSRDDWTVYVRPELVAEIAFSDIQESPRYPAGVALRFARVKRYRPDKSAAEADTIQTVMEIFRASK